MSSLHSLSTTRRSTPSRRVRAGLAVAAVLAVVTPLAAACGAGFDSASMVVKPNSGAGEVAAVRINNVWVVVDPGSGTAEVIGAVSNTGGDDLSWPSVQVAGSSARIRTPQNSTDAAGSNVATASSGIPAGQAVSFGEQGQPEIQLTDSSLTPGNLTQVTFSFGSVGSVTITAQIETDTGLFAGYNPDAAAAVPGGAGSSASATPLNGASASPSGNATSSASAAAGDSASATASASAIPSASAS